MKSFACSISARPDRLLDRLARAGVDRCSRLLAISRQLGGSPGTVDTTQSIGIVHQRLLECGERLGRLPQFQQELAEHFSHWDDATGHHDVLFGFIFQVGSLAHEFQCVAVPAFRPRNPR